MYAFQATVGTSRYRIVTAGGGALIVFSGPSRCCDGMAIWSGGGGILVAADASFVPHDDRGVLALARRSCTVGWAPAATATPRDCKVAAWPPAGLPGSAHKLLICANPLLETRSEPHAQGG